MISSFNRNQCTWSFLRKSFLVTKESGLYVHSVARASISSVRCAAGQKSCAVAGVGNAPPSLSSDPPVQKTQGPSSPPIAYYRTGIANVWFSSGRALCQEDQHG